jgi:Co/Zn/Cd efflux system component
MVLAINAVMFLVEAGAGMVVRSTALLGDSLDMLGDALVYAATLYAFTQASREKAKAVVLKGGVMLVLGGVVLVDAVSQLRGSTLPHAATVGTVGFLALAANVVCMIALLRHRTADINMSSAWVCSRNDVIANVAVLASAGAVGALGTRWPDLVVGAGIAALFLVSATSVLRDGLRALRA